MKLVLVILINTCYTKEEVKKYDKYKKVENKMKNFTITSAIFNEIEELLENTFYDDNYEIVRQLAENECDFPDDISEDERFEMVDDEINNIISINRISKDGLLYHALLKWHNRNESHNLNGYSLKVLENVRSAVLDDNYLYYVTGYGYDTISSDLLGGCADGEAKREFLKWINS